MSESIDRQPCVKIYERPDRFSTEYVVWLEPNDEDEFVGLCIGTASSRQEALTEAVAALERALTQIQDGRV